MLRPAVNTKIETVKTTSEGSQTSGHISPMVLPLRFHRSEKDAAKHLRHVHCVLSSKIVQHDTNFVTFTIPELPSKRCQRDARDAPIGFGSNSCRCCPTFPFWICVFLLFCKAIRAWTGAERCWGDCVLDRLVDTISRRLAFVCTNKWYSNVSVGDPIDNTAPEGKQRASRMYCKQNSLVREAGTVVRFEYGFFHRNGFFFRLSHCVRPPVHGFDFRSPALSRIWDKHSDIR